MKTVKMLMAVFIIIGLFGCSKPEPIEDMFEVGMDELMDIQVHQPFTIVGYIKNRSNFPWEIWHGAGMFSYKIFDEKGEPVSFGEKILHRNDIGYIKELNPGEAYRNNGEEHRSKEFYEFVITQPGRYKVRLDVVFQVKSG